VGASQVAVFRDGECLIGWCDETSSSVNRNVASKSVQNVAVLKYLGGRETNPRRNEKASTIWGMLSTMKFRTFRLRVSYIST
jgi:hypothetical protein